MRIDLELTPASTYEDVAELARAASLEHRGRYVTVAQDFGPCFLLLSRRLSVHAPGDTPRALRCYWLNGRRRDFTTAQVAAYQRAGHRGHG